eukprot:GHVP01026503.1.p2 GENE.GHVP01026503.1~~GHVP01026503.1.p2  ORF type:complete len:148 (+),score=38.19 GHVP01026503.1:25-468(+)
MVAYLYGAAIMYPIATAAMAATEAATASSVLGFAAGTTVAGGGAALVAAGVGAAAAATVVFVPVFVGLEYKSVVATWDCWKPIVRNYSENPSRGILLEELLEDSRIQNWNFQDSRIHVVNIWDEVFEITAVGFIEGVQAAHATQIMI